MVLIAKKYGVCRNDKRSFRPLAGIMVLINGTNLSILASKKTFPSPCGDYGSYQEKKR